MTTLVQGAFDEAALAPLGRRVIVRELSPGVSMVDVDGVPAATVSEVLRDSGAVVIDEAPVVVAEPEPERGVIPFFPPQPPPMTCQATACVATPCAAQSCTADNRPLLVGIDALAAQIAKLDPRKDLLDAIDSRFTPSTQMTPPDPWWVRWSPTMAAGGVALLFELVAHLH